MWGGRRGVCVWGGEQGLFDVDKRGFLHLSSVYLCMGDRTIYWREQNGKSDCPVVYYIQSSCLLWWFDCPSDNSTSTKCSLRKAAYNSVFHDDQPTITHLRAFLFIWGKKISKSRHIRAEMKIKLCKCQMREKTQFKVQYICTSR